MRHDLYAQVGSMLLSVDVPWDMPQALFPQPRVHLHMLLFTSTPPTTFGGIVSETCETEAQAITAPLITCCDVSVFR